MKKTVALLLCIAGSSLIASAKAFIVPEIDPSGAVNALILISGAVLMVRGRRK